MVMLPGFSTDDKPAKEQGDSQIQLSPGGSLVDFMAKALDSLRAPKDQLRPAICKALEETEGKEEEYNSLVKLLKSVGIIPLKEEEEEEKVIYDEEAAYDAEILPAMRALAEVCRKSRVPFLIFTRFSHRSIGGGISRTGEGLISSGCNRDGTEKMVTAGMILAGHLEADALGRLSLTDKGEAVLKASKDAQEKEGNGDAK